MEKMPPFSADSSLACYKPSPFEGLEQTEKIVSTAKRVVEDAFFSYRDTCSYYKNGGWEGKKTPQKEATAGTCTALIGELEKARLALTHLDPEKLRVSIVALESLIARSHDVGSLNCINSMKALRTVLQHIDVKTTMNAGASGNEPDITFPRDEEFEDDSKVA